MEELPTELTIDILSRLPVKTIIHCKLVCKKWRDLVSESSFVNLHLSRSPRGLLIHHDARYLGDRYIDPGILKWVEIEDKVDHHHDPSMSFNLNLAHILQNSAIGLKGSINGLILLWQARPSRYLKFDNVYICNPVTREIMILPGQRNYILGYTTIVYGFGVGSVTGEYKVVRTFPKLFDLDDDEIQAEVYTLGTGQWRSLGGPPYQLTGPFGGTFLNDHCHWIVNKKNAPEMICTFDLNKETFQLFPSPPIENSYIHPRSLGVLKGCLCTSDFYDFQLTIWVMKEYGIKKSWHKEVVITDAVSRGLEWSLVHPISLIHGLEDGSILIVNEGRVWHAPLGLTLSGPWLLTPGFELGWVFPQHQALTGRLPHWGLLASLGQMTAERKQLKSMADFLPHLRLRLIDSSIEELPAELTINILSRLPVNTIIHCKLVCKKWRNLVSDSSFVDLHLSRSPTGLIVHGLRGDRDPRIFRLVEIEDKVDHHHLDPLMSLDLNMDARSPKVDNTYICNPITREYMILPRQQHYTGDYGFEVSSRTGGVQSEAMFEKARRNGRHSAPWLKACVSRHVMPEARHGRFAAISHALKNAATSPWLPRLEAWLCRHATPRAIWNLG
ncbi:hypothetical protein OSB04_un000237 [Centaurea solstitialis]|uniref:F-box domain-containing protein n=1 Tax=Centaurea solstitialis TaxID=347529 RepID=A0AA38SQV8_9ASTR|nr:hypothetical protein OSB04_un000237 [Centaurea solstitialis]